MDLRRSPSPRDVSAARWQAKNQAFDFANSTPRGLHEESISTRRCGRSNDSHGAAEAVLTGAVGKDGRRTDASPLQYNHGHGLGEIRWQARAIEPGAREECAASGPGSQSDATYRFVLLVAIPQD